jgi:hypothetical protein
MSSQGLADQALAPYEAIVEHAELELELAGAGDLDGLTALAARWEQLVSELPTDPPAAARPLLEQARLVHERTRVELLRLHEALLADMDTTTRARRTADGYAGQLRRRPRLNRTA